MSVPSKIPRTSCPEYAYTSVPEARTSTKVINEARQVFPTDTDYDTVNKTIDTDYDLAKKSYMALTWRSQA